MKLSIIDDHALIRVGLTSFLELEDDIQVVGEASTASEGLELLRRTPCDLALVDMKLPDHDGIWLTRTAKSAFPDLRIIILTMHREDALVLEAIEAGAMGYVLKSASAEELLDAIRTVSTGGLYLHHQVVRTVVGEFRNRRNHEMGRNGELSRREIGILQGIADGRSNRDIAAEVHLSLSTIKASIRQLFSRFSVSDRTQLVVEAMRQGIIEAPQSE